LCTGFSAVGFYRHVMNGWQSGGPVKITICMQLATPAVQLEMKSNLCAHPCMILSVPIFPKVFGTEMYVFLHTINEYYTLQEGS
jgi:hypothetical protein